MFKVLDLFAGIGGFSLGLERAGMQTVAFCEIDEHCRKVLVKHWPLIPIYSDIRKLKSGHLPKNINVIVGGFPCQNISTSGKGEGLNGDRSGLWKEFYRLIKEIQPGFIIVENVANLRSKGLNQILKDLWKIGYDSEWHIFSARMCGAPHLRERVWIIAYPIGRGPQRQGFCSDAINPTPDAYREASGLNNAVQAQRLPYVCTRHDGIPDKLARIKLKQLGNSLVPQIVEYIGRQIMDNNV